MMDDEAACFGCFRLKRPGAFGACPLHQVGGEAALSGKKLFLQAAAALLPPVLGFAAGFVVPGLIFPHIGEGPRAGAGLTLMFLCALAYYAYRSRFPAGTCRAKTAIIEKS
ncbi:MAG: hypothetical protein LBQ46_13410 [Treponema sp.]|jgi:sigma-E factor negative regulatory protein RseC|nr:hypothetical protein [Treponema sp.]